MSEHLSNSKFIYAVKDRLAQDFNYPFYAVSDLVALRTSIQALPSQFDLDSFELYCLGEFSHDTGYVIGFDQPSFICKLSDAEALFNKMKSEL